MMNPMRRNSYSSSNNNSQTHQSISLSSLSNLLKKPHAVPFLLIIFLFLTWVSLRIQRSPSSGFSAIPRDPQKWGTDDDMRPNLVKLLPAQLVKDKRGWLLNPIASAFELGISGGAVTCASIHVGEIRPGGIRGNHRHFACNETLIIWGAKTRFRLENSQVAEKGYAEAVIDDDEVAIAACPSGTAHALVNIDPLRTTYFLGCQDSTVNTNSSNTVYNVWKDL
ncbi:hypothetical protein Dimus_029796 [Dionaea muscipula]